MQTVMNVLQPFLLKMHPYVLKFGLRQITPTGWQLLETAQSTSGAAVFGGVYGLIERYYNPNQGIVPGHYALWFVAAHRIHQLAVQIFSLMNLFIYEEPAAGKERVLLNALSIEILSKTDYTVDRIDGFFSNLFKIRPRKEVKKENVDRASYLEMCRFRVWRSAKSILITHVSFQLGNYLVKGLGFKIVAPAAIPLFILIQSIFSNILLLPTQHKIIDQIRGLERVRNKPHLRRFYDRLKAMLPSIAA